MGETSSQLKRFLLVAGFGLAVALALLWVLSEFQEEITERFLHGLDASLMSFLHAHAHASSSLTTAMLMLSLIGSWKVMQPLVLAGLAWLLWSGNRREAVVFAVCVYGALALSVGFKLWFHRPRPSVSWALAHASTYSFPSGHSVDAVAFYGVVALIVLRHTGRKALSSIIVILAILLILGIGVSRIYLGVHYPTDVAAGYLTGSVWLAAVYLGNWYMRSSSESTSVETEANRAEAPHTVAHSDEIHGDENGRIVKVILNHAAGKKPEESETLCRIFLQHGITPSISLVRNGEDIRGLARDAVSRGYKVIVAGGGDGTVSAVASALVGTRCSLGILPLGTLNHFAKDMKLPFEISEAVRVIAEQRVIDVDVGEVNGQTFLNNSGIGIYPAIVAERERLQKHGLRKMFALVIAFFKVLRRFPHVTVRLEVDGKALVRKTSFIFVGNNEYDFEGTKIGTRQRLDAGHLQLCMTGKMTRMELLRVGFGAVLGSGILLKGFESFRTDELRVESRRRNLRVAFDGEVMRTSPPLNYKVLPRALRVIAPGGSDENSR
ncbi:MAG TPA: diacylglycerol kinase family protein [Candidatus Dormibacteraeota bacterium]|nr:diacylglycerol kinase family protein [Candidatus Dormibacteraeota bacterium]